MGLTCGHAIGSNKSATQSSEWQDLRIKKPEVVRLERRTARPRRNPSRMVFYNHGSPIMSGERTRQNRPLTAKHIGGLLAIVVFGFCLVTLTVYGQTERRLFPTAGKMLGEVLDTAGGNPAPRQM